MTPHQEKMAYKADQRAKLHDHFLRYPREPQANLSRNHPDYGKTPKAHALRKEMRQTIARNK